MATHRENETPIVPREYSGKWIAWDHSQTKIVASGQTFGEARQRALDAGEPDPILAKVPNSAVRFVGGLL
jgi:hypothetical protein